jgi:PAS domain S-box-containing protein
MDLIKSLVLNLSVIIALSFISSMVYQNFYKKKNLHILLQTLLFCGLTTFSIYNRVVVYEVFFFDARSVLISISTLLFGWIVGAATAITSFVIRVSISSVNPISTSVSVIIPFFLGLLFNRLLERRLFILSGFNLLLFGLLNSVLLFFSLYIISPIRVDQFLKIQQAALVVFPFVTLLVGYVIYSGINKTYLVEKIRENYSYWKATFHSISEAIITLDTQGKIREVNETFINLFGSFNNNIQGVYLDKVIKVFEFDTKQDITSTFSNYIITKDSTIIERRKVYIVSNNREIPSEIYLTDIVCQERRKLGYVLVMRDLRDELESQRKILESEKTFRGIFNSLNEAIYIHDIEGKFIDVNDGAVKMYGYEKNEIIGKTPAFLSAEKKNENLDLQSIWLKAFNGEPQIFEFWGKRKDGTIFPKIVSIYAGDYFGENVLIAVALDITVLRKAQDKIIEQEKLLRTLLNATPDIIYVKNEDGKWVEINKGLTDLLNIQIDTIINKTNDEVLYSLLDWQRSLLLKFEDVELKTLNQRKIIREELALKTADENLHYFDVLCIPISEDDSSIHKIILIGREISLLKQGEIEKQVMLNNLSAIVENFGGGILLLDVNQKIEILNDNFLKLFKLRYRKNHFQSNDFDFLIDYLKDTIINIDKFVLNVKNLFKSKVLESELEILTNEQKIIEVNFISILHDGQIVNHLLIFNDVTESRTLETKLKSQLSELERFNKSMIDRELRMIQLKEEVNQLFTKVGLPPKYKIFK